VVTRHIGLTTMRRSTRNEEKPLILVTLRKTQYCMQTGALIAQTRVSIAQSRTEIAGFVAK
jgi:hypothetical protein